MGEHSLKSVVNQSVGENKQFDFILVGDNDHNTEAATAFLADPQAIQDFQEMGGRHIFIEHPDFLQGHIDALYDGEIDIPTFVETAWDHDEYSFKDTATDPAITEAKLENLGEAILLCAQYGIEIHAADTKTISPPEILKAWDDINAYQAAAAQFSQDFSQNNQDLLRQAQANGTLQQLSDRMTAKFNEDNPDLLNALLEADIKIRNFRADDTDLLNIIREKSDGSPSMVVYGSAHFFDNLEKSLGNLMANNQNIVTLDTGLNAQELAERREFLNGSPDWAKTPDFAYLDDGGFIYTAANAPTADAKLEAAATPQP